jgi:sugar phosphate isomerase/epimerase
MVGLTPMSSKSNRRRFIKTTLLAGTGLTTLCTFVEGAEPFKRKGSPRFPLSIAAYSFRDYFNAKDPAKKITLFDFIDYCADQGCQGAELTSYYFPKKVETQFLLEVKRHAFLRGIEISGSAVGNNFALAKGEKRDQQIAMVKEWVDYSAIMGAPHIRVFAGSKGAMDFNEAKKLCIEGLEECSDYAGQKGIFLGLENHHGIVTEPEDLLEIVRSVRSPWFGINLDTGNFQTDDPYADLAKCAPYAVNVQVKVEVKRRAQTTAEPTDYSKIAKLLRDANYQGYVALEYEAKEDAFKAIPSALKSIKAALAI